MYYAGFGTPFERDKKNDKEAVYKPSNTYDTDKTIYSADGIRYLRPNHF